MLKNKVVYNTVLKHKKLCLSFCCYRFSANKGLCVFYVVKCVIFTSKMDQNVFGGRAIRTHPERQVEDCTPTAKSCVYVIGDVITAFHTSRTCCVSSSRKSTHGYAVGSAAETTETFARSQSLQAYTAAHRDGG